MAAPYQEEIERQQKENVAVEEKLRIAEQLYLLFTKRRDLLPIDANKALLNRYFGDDTRKLTLETLLLAVEHEGLKKQLAWHATDEDLRAQLTDEIYQLVQGSPQARQHVVESLKYKSTAEIAEQRDELRRRSAVRELPKDELKVMARGAQPSQFMEIPTLYRSRSMLLDLANTNVAEFRQLVKKCGEAQINKMLTGKT